MVYLRVCTTNVPIEYPEIIRKYSESIDWILGDKYDTTTIIGYPLIKNVQSAKYVLDCIYHYHQNKEMPELYDDVTYGDIHTVILCLELNGELREKIPVYVWRLSVNLYKKYIDKQELSGGCGHVEYYFDRNLLKYLEMFIQMHNDGGELPKCKETDINEVLAFVNYIGMKPEFIEAIVEANKFE